MKENVVLVLPRDATSTTLVVDQRVVTFTVGTVTPELATLWLENNIHNRPVSQRVVNEYRSQMMASEWRINFEGLIFDHEGKLLDGQHRLWACVESGTPFCTLIIQGVDPTVFMTLNTGKRRSPSDNLTIAEISSRYTTIIASAAKIVLAYRQNQIQNLAIFRPTNAATIEMLRAEPGLIKLVERARAVRGYAGYASSISSVVHLASTHQQARADEFLDKFATGADLSQGSPILALRTRLTQPSLDQRGIARFVTVVLAWNAYCDNREMRVIRLPTDKAVPRVRGAAT